jgi:hypothetical protein
MLQSEQQRARCAHHRPIGNRPVKWGQLRASAASPVLRVRLQGNRSSRSEHAHHGLSEAVRQVSAIESPEVTPTKQRGDLCTRDLLGISSNNSKSNIRP